MPTGPEAQEEGERQTLGSGLVPRTPQGQLSLQYQQPLAQKSNPEGPDVECKKDVRVYSVTSDSSCNPMDCSPPGSLCPWDFPSKNTEVGFHFLFHGIFPTQGLNPGLLHWRQILYH